MQTSLNSSATALTHGLPAGTCIDTQALDCAGASTRSGFCPGLAHVVCCPAPGTPKDKQSTHAGSSCLYGRKGTCIDALATRCDGVATVKGHCTGLVSFLLRHTLHCRTAHTPCTPHAWRVLPV